LHGGVLDPDRRARLERAVDQVRPAGITVQLLDGSVPAKVSIDLRITTAKGLLEAQLRAAQDSIRKKFTDYFAALPIKSDGSVTRLIGLAIGVDGVEDVRITAAKTGLTDVLDIAAGALKLASQPTELGEIRITDPALATALTLVVRYPRSEPIPDQAALGAAVESALATLNALAENPNPADTAKRTLGWSRLTRVLPLPHAGWTTATLAQQFAGAPATGDAEVGKYTVQWVFTRPTGVSQVLDAAAAPALALAPEERLSLARASVEVKPKS
jgi:hypothetical protein